VIRSKKKAVRVKSISLDGREQMASVPLDSEFFGLYKLECVNGTWSRSDLAS